MIVSSQSVLTDQARFLAIQGREAAAHYEHTQIGRSFRLSNLLAAVGRGQLRVLSERVQQSRAKKEFYQSALSDVAGVTLHPDPGWGTSSRWLTVIQIQPPEFGATPEAVRPAPEAREIEARLVWKPMHLRPAFDSCQSIGGCVATQLFERGPCLPSGSALAHDELDENATLVRKASSRKSDS